MDSLTGLDQATVHAFYRLDNGNYLDYNNGGRMHNQDNSSVHEFRLDQNNRVAELVRVRVFNILGQPLTALEPVEIPEGTTTVLAPIHEKNSGIWIIMVETAGKSWYRKIFL